MLKRQKGFTLIEIMLVVVIIGIMLAVIVPRGYRANQDAKYGNVRQAGSELAAKGIDWAEQKILSTAGTTSNLTNYLLQLSGTPSGDMQSVGVGKWTNVHRLMGNAKPLVNPFDGIAYVNQTDDDTTAQGSLHCAYYQDIKSNHTINNWAMLWYDDDGRLYGDQDGTVGSLDDENLAAGVFMYRNTQ
jgi:prepilin-type N-terminal cleavage/methylation domain-containing protein